MGYPKKVSPCATCEEVFETEWPEALAFYCGAISDGRRCLLEIQRLKHPRGTQFEITEGPLEGCPYHQLTMDNGQLTIADGDACREARKRLEEALGANG